MGDKGKANIGCIGPIGQGRSLLNISELFQKIKENADNESPIEIRLYDNKSGKAFYKQLTFNEAMQISSILHNPILR